MTNRDTAKMALAAVLDCQPSEMEYWYKVLGLKLSESGPTPHQAASIGAIVWVRKHTPRSKKQLERFFAMLAFSIDGDAGWWVVRVPRAPMPEVVLEAPAIDTSDRLTYSSAAVFEKKAFLAELVDES